MNHATPLPNDWQSAIPPLRRPWWMISKHLETIYCLWDERGRAALECEREVVATADGDRVLMEWKMGAADKPMVVVFHGLEGCARTRAVSLVAHYFAGLGWTVAIPYFRSCGTMNLLPRAYHAADGEDPQWMMQYLCARFGKRECYAVGISLGGNALIHALDAGRSPVRAAAAVSAPLNLPAAAANINRGMAHAIYGRYFVKKLCRKIEEKCRQFPAICTPDGLRRIRTIGDFDNAYTAPVHGFNNADEYWRQGSTFGALERMATPLLCINARNDPMVPVVSLPQSGSQAVSFIRPRHGGHGGFFGRPKQWLGETIHHFFDLAAKAAPSPAPSPAAN